MKSTLKFLLFCSSLISINAIAAGAVNAGDINYILFYKGHTGLLIKHQYPSDPDNCGRQDYYILPDSHPHYSQIYALLLAAQMANKKISLTVDSCHEGIPAIIHVGLSKQ